MQKNSIQTDVVIVGAGVAGLSALRALDPKMGVILLNPGRPTQTGSTWRAQGGVAVALADDDTPALHAADTHAAARDMADEEAVRILTAEGPLRVRELLESGMEVDRSENGEALFGLEAAHCRARVIHHKDQTGKALIGHLWEEARDRPGLRFCEERCLQILVNGGGVAGVLTSGGHIIRAPRVILASGGFAGLFEATTTGREVRGEGIALAAQAGAQVRDLEFVQFHPTALDQPVAEGPLPLLTEALRGGGAKLRLDNGERFVEELLPRDEVARAIASQRKLGRTVFLDVTEVENFAHRFPGAHSHLRQSCEGQRGWLPVRPAAHYTIGGVLTDTLGRTTVEGLYACGEVASVGVHGANRLASNSLLEGLVFGHRAGRQAASTLRSLGSAPLLPVMRRICEGPELAKFRRFFEEACGVVRTAQGLTKFLSWAEAQPETLEVWLGAHVAAAALARTHSVGAHFRADSPALTGLHQAG